MADDSPTEVHLPESLPFPIQITSIDAPAKSNVQRGDRLITYSFLNGPKESRETRFGTWDSALDGIVDSWNIKAGDLIGKEDAKIRPALAIVEPCKHGMQLGGLCVLCGKDMTNVDYIGFSDTSRASIQMTHSAFGPTVSLTEARRIERETAQRLLNARKLSLIVDLDQTIVHATVDPTVGEWIAEGEAWEARQAKKVPKPPPGDDDSDSSDAESDDEDECNPNWEALKDVKSFRLGPESFGPLSLRRQHMNKGKQKMVENEGCMYYIKPRPGWKEFLREMATKYEMHVYTMGTRAYAEEVCAAIDPDGSVFGGRLLSRDESGSLTQKSLQRLFPCDTSMVVIIDDRADVWEWSPNLVKVIPYDFFVGIGDINSTFLPKIEPLTTTGPIKPPAGKPPPPITPSIGTSPPADNAATAAPETSEPTPDASTTPSPTSEPEPTELETKAFLTNNAALDAQLEERPLAKKQEELQEHETQEQEQAQQKPETTETKDPSPSPSLDKTQKKALLKNDDYELDRIGKLLDQIYTRFFSAYDTKSSGKPEQHDVTAIIPRLRSEVFDGVHILFSSVIPLDTRPETTEIWRMAHMFGAKVSTELTGGITHVVAAKRGTVKVDLARKQGGIKIVWLSWFTDSIALWRRQDETPYLLDEPSAPIAPTVAKQDSASPGADGITSSDIDVDDSEDWDQEPEMPIKGPPGRLELESIDWGDINAEVEAAMNESDGDDDDSWSMHDGTISEGDDLVDDMNSATGSVNNTPRLKRKRLRSSTPSEGGRTDVDDDELLRSPLSKRKKIAAERTGFSRLKDGITADDIADAGTNGSPGSSPPPTSGVPTDEIEEGDEEEEEEEEEEEDFLARAFEEEEWG